MIALAGIPASSGAAIGPARVMKRISFDIPDAHSADPEAEKARFRSAVSSAAVEISNLKAAAEKKLGRAEAEIFAAHALMLEDPALEDAVADGITVGLTAESAVAGAIRNLAAQFDSMEDDYFKQRAADVKDIGRRILKKLEGEKSASPENDSACILVTDELLPSDTISLDTARTAGIVTERGGAASHASILARALGIPCVVGVEGLLERTSDGVEIAIDGGKGEVLIHPSENAKKRFESVAAAAREKRAAAMKRKNEPAVTVDGCVIPVFGNAGSVADVAAAIANGAEGIGLFRTEFLFLGRKTMPTEDEQTAEYSAAAAAAGGKPVTIRLLDIGGDKPAEYLAIPSEANPFLGFRAIRLLLERRDVLKTQIRAILRAAASGDLLILVPMISDISELKTVREIRDECLSELEREGKECKKTKLGAMIEVPAAALCADRLAAAADFFSIGTNDLTQYCMAADRGNAAVAHLFNPAHPAVLSLIEHTVRGARAAHIKVSVCGEAAADETAAREFVSLGVDYLSVAPAAVPLAKETVRTCRVSP